MITARQDLYLYLSRLVPDLRSRRARHLLGNLRALYGVLLEALGDSSSHHQQSPDGQRDLLYRIEHGAPGSGPLSILVQTAKEPDWSRTEKADAFLRATHQREFRQRRDDGTPIYEQGQFLRFRLHANPTIAAAQPRDGASERPRGRVKPLYGDTAKALVRSLRAAGQYRLTQSDSTTGEPGAAPLPEWLAERILGTDPDGPTRAIAIGELAQLAWLVRKLDGIATIVDARVIDLGEASFPIDWVDDFQRDEASPSPRRIERSGRIHRRPPSRLLAVRFDGILQVLDPERFAATIATGIGRGRAFGLGMLSVART